MNSTDNDNSSTRFPRPRWLTMLFRLFVTNYKGLWTSSLDSPELQEANDFLWTSALQGYAENVVMATALEAMKMYHYPPSIHQFLEIANGLTRKARLETSSKKLLDYQPGAHNQAPMSPLVAEYMAAHPLQENDEFKLIFSRYRGKERGQKTMELIKKRLGKSYAKPRKNG